MLKIKDLEISFPGSEFHLTVPEFSVAEKEKVAVIGPSGSGKTTLMNVIAGILVPENGTIHINKSTVNLLTDTQRRQFRISHIGFVFQDFGLIEYLSTLDNILHPYRISNVLTLDKKVRKRALDLADSLGVGKQLGKPPDTLSHGEKQRVAICRALVTQPELILADEATGNLDPDNKLRILKLLFAAVDQHDATLIAVTHDHALLPHFDCVKQIGELRKDERCNV